MASVRKISEIEIDSKLYDEISFLADQDGITVEEEARRLLCKVIELPR